MANFADAETQRHQLKLQEFKERRKQQAQEAQNEWRESLQEVEGKLSRRTKRVDCLTNEIYQLVGLYAVFVGVVFGAVQSDRAQCQHVWSPIVLCLLPCFIIVHILDQKLADIKRIRGEICDDESSRRVLKKNLMKLKEKGPLGFDFKKDVTEGKYPEREHESITPRSVRVVLLLSSGLIVGSFLHILCFTKGENCQP